MALLDAALIKTLFVAFGLLLIAVGLATTRPGQRFISWFSARRRARRTRVDPVVVRSAEDALIDLIRDPADVDPELFELGVALILSRLWNNAEVERVGGSGDRGVDLRCLRPDGQLIVVQCKRYTPPRNAGGPEVVQLLGSMTHFRAAIGLLVTSSSFTREAVNIAAAHDEVTLIDGAALARHAEQVLRAG